MSRVVVAVDCMGGDHGPRVTVAASVAAIDADPELSIVLVGLSDAIAVALSAAGRTEGERLRVLHKSDHFLVVNKHEDLLYNSDERTDFRSEMMIVT